MPIWSNHRRFLNLFAIASYIWYDSICIYSIITAPNRLFSGTKVRNVRFWVQSGLSKYFEFSSERKLLRRKNPNLVKKPKIFINYPSYRPCRLIQNGFTNDFRVKKTKVVMFGESWSKLIDGQTENGIFGQKWSFSVININPSSTSQSLNCF